MNCTHSNYSIGGMFDEGEFWRMLYLAVHVREMDTDKVNPAAVFLARVRDGTRIEDLPAQSVAIVRREFGHKQ